MFGQFHKVSPKSSPQFSPQSVQPFYLAFKFSIVLKMCSNRLKSVFNTCFWLSFPVSLNGRCLGCWAGVEAKLFLPLVFAQHSFMFCWTDVRQMLKSFKQCFESMSTRIVHENKLTEIEKRAKMWKKAFLNLISVVGIKQNKEINKWAKMWKENQKKKGYSQSIGGISSWSILANLPFTHLPRKYCVIWHYSF